MPLTSSNYSPFGPFKNGHFSTIYSAKLRITPSLVQERERLTLPDGDFLDIDWSISHEHRQRVVVLLHGLEGNSQRTYMKGMAALLIQNGWDVAAVNFRGCSGTPNKNFDSYNAGRTQDLEAAIASVLGKDLYTEIALIGFSLGGNLLMKYLGERDIVPKEIKKGVAISAPLSLQGSLECLDRRENWLYRTVFLTNLRKKYREKMSKFPEKATMETYQKIKSILDFDNLYTAPAHGFKDAQDYYQKNSSGQFIASIQVPTLLLNARNDSFLSSDCLPYEFAMSSQKFYLEAPKYGGHVGFHLKNSLYYSEKRALEFINE